MAELSEDELKKVEAQLRLVIESSPAAIVIVDPMGRVVLVNRQAEQWFGYSRDELFGRDVEILIPERYHRKHREHRRQFMTQPQARPMAKELELYGRRKDGREFPVDVSLHPMDAEDGQLIMAHIVDVTDRKRAEDAAQRKRGLERLAQLGQLAAGVAHEIRNPLGVIRNATYYLQINREALDADGQESIDEIEREVRRASHIVDDLLDFAKDPAGQASTFNLNELITNLANKFAHPPGVVLALEEVTPDLRVVADLDQTQRILENLMRNAVQAIGEVGHLTVRYFQEANSGVVDVIDDGAGIRAEDRERVFEPLYTTRAYGIGLGLAVARRYAERNGGSLELVDHGGRGAVFRLRLPLRTSPGKP